MMRMRSLLAAFLLLALPLAAPARTLPVVDFIRHPEFKNVVISPDGKYLAVVAAVGKSGRYQLVILPTSSVLNDKPRVTAHYGLTDYEIFDNIFWVNNKRVAASTATQYGGFDRPFSTGKLFAINVNGAFEKELMGQSIYFGGLIDRLPKNPRAILVYGGYGRNAYWLDVYTGASHTVATSPIAGGGLLADHNGNVRVAWGYNTLTGQPLLYYRDAHSMNWKNASSSVDHDQEAAAALATGGVVMFGPDNKSLFFEDWADNPAETMGLYRYNFDTGEKTLIYANPKVDIDAEFPDYNPFVESFSRDNLVGLRIMPGKLETLALDSKAPKIQLLAALGQAIPDAQIQITSWTRDGTQAIVKTLSDTQPIAYFLYSSKPKPSLALLFRETPWIKSGDLSPMHPISYKSRDGLTIHGYLTLPRGAATKNLPMVVYVHGGPHGIRTDWGFDPNDFDSVATQLLANHGYAVLALNYRGSGGYGLKFLEAGFRHWGDTMQNDLADGVNWAVKQGIANPKRVCIFGASYGGYAALMSAERFPGLYRCAIGYSGVYDLFVLKSRKSGIARWAGGRLYENTVLGSNTKQLKAFSPVYNADKLKIPVFLLHGGRDEIAPVKGYDEMVAAIKKNGTPLQTLYETNEGHGFYKPAHREKAWNEILAFLDRYIGPAPLTASGAGSGTH